MLGRDVAQTNARLRLKWAMDYWVALWFWPIRKADSLPGRDEWLFELGQINLFPDTQPRQLAVKFTERHGMVRVNKLLEDLPRLRQVEKVMQRIRPLHWDVEFADRPT